MTRNFPFYENCMISIFGQPGGWRGGARAGAGQLKTPSVI